MTETMPPLLASFVRHEHTRIDLALHEAGHAVAGILNGGVLTSSTVIEGRWKLGLLAPPDGSTSFASLPPHRHAQVALAGPWAQARGRLGRRPGSHEVAAVLGGTGCRDREVLTAAGGPDAGESVIPLLERCWPSVAELAVKLHRTGRITEADVLGALSLSADPATRTLELSMIRSGAEPGSFSVSRPA